MACELAFYFTRGPSENSYLVPLGLGVRERFHQVLSRLTLLRMRVLAGPPLAPGEGGSPRPQLPRIEGAGMSSFLPSRPHGGHPRAADEGTSGSEGLSGLPEAQLSGRASVAACQPERPPQRVLTAPPGTASCCRDQPRLSALGVRGSRRSDGAGGGAGGRMGRNQRTCAPWWSLSSLPADPPHPPNSGAA